MLRPTKALALAIVLATSASGTVRAQAPATPASPPAAAPPASPVPATNSSEGKRGDCRRDVRQKGLRGLDRIDAMQICMAEGRLDCVKQAVAQKLPVAKRRDFIKTCSTGK